MRKTLAIVVGALAVLAACASSQAGLISPVSYDMPNGGSGVGQYRDDTYNGSGNKTVDYSPLSGGLGDLTDGVIATNNHAITPLPYVGWRYQDVPITFHFANRVTFTGVTVYMDDSNVPGTVRPPASILLSVGSDSLSQTVIDPDGLSPFGFHIGLPNWTGDVLNMTLFRKAQWMMISEVTFEGSVVPEPSTLVMLTSLGVVGAVVAWRRRRKAG